MTDKLRSILKRLGIGPSEKWVRVDFNGREIWESDAFRRDRAREAQDKKDRTRLRESLGIKEEDVALNADMLLKLLEECYPFGDPSFRPDIIYRIAGSKYGFEPQYIMTLIDDLIRRRLILFEYSQDSSLHPKDSLDRWRLTKNA